MTVVFCQIWALSMSHWARRSVLPPF